MRRLKTVLWLEGYAVLLALLQTFNGVRTDEAKYLLDIPYPHPPLARWTLSLFDGFAWQELGARVLFATLLVQAAWFVWDMGRALSRGSRVALCALWLGSACLVLQAGTVMMAPLTAFQALVFLWILSLPRERAPSSATIGLLWLATLFTALQGALLLPLAVAALRLRGATWRQVAWYAGAPAALVALYAAGNPLVLASFGLQAGKDAADTMLGRGVGLLRILTLAGSGVGTLAGVVGLVLKRHWFILASFALVSLYVFVGRYDYYAIIFLPFLVTGWKHLFRRVPRIAVPVAIGTILCTFVVLWYVPLVQRHPAEDAMAFIAEKVPAGPVAIRGPFGHEWQYELTPDHPVGRYVESAAHENRAVVCVDECPAPVEGVYALEEAGPYRIWFRTGGAW